MADFEHVIGSIDDMDNYMYESGPLPSAPVWKICNHGLDAAPKHTIEFSTKNQLFWCMKCGLPLSFVQIDRYVSTSQYDIEHRKALADYDEKMERFKGQEDDDTHIERKDGVNIISYPKDNED